MISFSIHESFLTSTFQITKKMMSVTILVQNIIFIAFPSNALEKVGFQISKSLVKTLQINLFDNQKKINMHF